MTNQRWVCEYLRCLFEEKGIVAYIKIGNPRGRFEHYSSKVILPSGYTTTDLLLGLEIVLRELGEGNWQGTLGVGPVWICRARLLLPTVAGTTRLMLMFQISWEEPLDEAR